MSLWRTFWAFIDSLSNPAIGAVCILLVVGYATHEKAAPVFAGSGFSGPPRHFSVEMVRQMSHLSFSCLRLSDFLK
jgi:hypothetical protein